MKIIDRCWIAAAFAVLLLIVGNAAWAQPTATLAVSPPICQPGCVQAPQPPKPPAPPTKGYVLSGSGDTPTIQAGAGTTFFTIRLQPPNSKANPQPVRIIVSETVGTKRIKFSSATLGGVAVSMSSTQHGEVDAKLPQGDTLLALTLPESDIYKITLYIDNPR